MGLTLWSGSCGSSMCGMYVLCAGVPALVYGSGVCAMGVATAQARQRCNECICTVCICLAHTAMPQMAMAMIYRRNSMIHL